jgi:hypothetical protein
VTVHRKPLAGGALDADTASIDTLTATSEPTMNTPFRTAPRFAAVAFAAFMTLATLMGVGGLADHSSAEVQMAQAAVVQQAA